MSVDFIMGLPISDEGHEGIITMADRAIKMVHLVLVTQTISICEIAYVVDQH